ncbi:PdaC/SigV domain-containing protein [Cohnella sp. WQ 127256]|uniref:PdaC/SigV domain-containing protein n=1 Tax=Cohnella sp. WQ 127256 TaxID=2938790 RepID=UPI002117FD25|nr:DUF4163 domain-containing protein [Cohnella sp. WQ 127256]
MDKKNARMKQLKKGIIALTVTAALVSAPLVLPAKHVNAASVSSYKIINQTINVDGVKTQLPAISTDSTTYIALRSLNQSIGLTTKWDKANNTVTVTGRDRVLVLNLGSGVTLLNNQQLYGLPAIVQNNTTYVPIRFLLERMGYGVSYDKVTKGIGIEAIKENDLKISTAVIKENDVKQTILVNYPQISGFANEAVQKKINDKLKSEAEANVEATRGLLKEALGDPIDDSLPDVSFEGTYTITYNEQGKLSLYVNYYIYTGGAHGSTARVPYTFDLATGNQLTLKEAAGGNAKYVSIINNEIQSQIKARGIGLLNPFKTIEQDREFFLKHNGVVVYFTQYEYTPYSEGMPEFEVPFVAFK